MSAHITVTLQELMRLALPVNTMIVAGRDGTDRSITWVQTLHTRPPAFPDLGGGELALLSLDALRLLSDKLTLANLIRELGDMAVSAIGVQGEISRPAREIADEMNVPLLHIPETASLRQIEHQVAQVLMGQTVMVETRGHQVREQLLQLLTENRGLNVMVEVLAQLTGKTIVVQDKRFNPLAFAGPLTRKVEWPAIESALEDSAPLPPLFRDRLEVAQASPDPVMVPLPGQGLQRLVAPIVAGKMGRGFLSLVFDAHEPYDQFDITFARHGAAACALEMAKEKAIREAQKRVQGNVLEQFLGGMLSEQEALLRLTRLGYQPDQLYSTLYLGGLRESTPSPRQIEALCNEQASVLGLGALVQPYGTEVIVFCEGDEAAARDMAVAVQNRAGERYDAAIVTGIGQCAGDLRAWRESFQQAVAAYRTAYQWKLSAPLAFREMGVYRLLSLLVGSPELSKFYYETLGELTEDTPQNADFLTTLDAFFEEHGNLTRTAKRLHIHRNTLLYRMDRIKEISDLDIDNPETRLAVYLALRIRRIL